MRNKTLLAVVLVLCAGEMAMADSYNATETAHYTVQQSDGAVEVRSYAPRLMAEVTVPGSQSQAVRAGFRILAGYIFGANEGAAKLAMTTPVAQAPAPAKIAMTTPVAQAQSGDGRVGQFMMPSSDTLDTLPKARDPRVRFVEVPSNRQAVLQFSGLSGAGKLAAKEAELRAWAAAQGLKIKAGLSYYFYDPPWTLPWNRRNEVAFVPQ